MTPSDGQILQIKVTIRNKSYNYIHTYTISLRDINNQNVINYLTLVLELLLWNVDLSDLFNI
jgi:hypothetical protein